MVYKIRVILDSKDNVFRDIEVKEKQTLWNLHLGIESAFNLKDNELSSFYFSDDSWSEIKAIPLEDMSDDGDGEVMSDIYISEGFPEKGSKMLFKYGFIDLWEFFCELIDVIPEKGAIKYPHTSYRFGNVPLKSPSKTKKTTSQKSKSDYYEEDILDMEENYKEDDFDESFNEDDETYYEDEDTENY